jgi:hypothetical protein
MKLTTLAFFSTEWVLFFTKVNPVWLHHFSSSNRKNFMTAKLSSHLYGGQILNKIEMISIH